MKIIKKYILIFIGTIIQIYLAVIPASSQAAPVSTVQVVATYPHDFKAFTQGLFFINGVLHETTGGFGASQLRRLNLKTGQVLYKANLEATAFGEGATLVAGRILWLTWHKETAGIYEPDTFKKTGQYKYKGQGWGLACSGQKLVMSNGSNILTFRHPETFATIRTLAVMDGTKPVTNLNELEWINGRIWANVWQTDYIAEIDPSNGNVLNWYDISALRPQSTKTDINAVANGIAFDSRTGKIFVTGKRWPVLYEIAIKK